MLMAGPSEFTKTTVWCSLTACVFSWYDVVLNDVLQLWQPEQCIQGQLLPSTHVCQEVVKRLISGGKNLNTSNTIIHEAECMRCKICTAHALMLQAERETCQNTSL